VLQLLSISGTPPLRLLFPVSVYPPVCPFSSLGALSSVPLLSVPYALRPGTWDLGSGTWDLGPGTWDLGPGTWDLGPGDWEEYAALGNEETALSAEGPGTGAYRTPPCVLPFDLCLRFGPSGIPPVSDDRARASPGGRCCSRVEAVQGREG